jgi:hypothetical protein
MVRKIVRKIYRLAKDFITGIFWYAKDLARYKSLLRKAGIAVPMKYFPQLFDRSVESHTFDKHYVYTWVLLYGSFPWLQLWFR